MKSDQFAVYRTHELDGGKITEKYKPGVTEGTVMVSLHESTKGKPNADNRISKEHLDVKEIPSDVLNEMYEKMSKTLAKFNPENVRREY
jgi:hypothetical protein